MHEKELYNFSKDSVLRGLSIREFINKKLDPMSILLVDPMPPLPITKIRKAQLLAALMLMTSEGLIPFGTVIDDYNSEGLKAGHTVGFGHNNVTSGVDVGLIMTPIRAINVLNSDIARYTKILSNRLVKTQFKLHQFTIADIAILIYITFRSPNSTRKLRLLNDEQTISLSNSEYHIKTDVMEEMIDLFDITANDNRKERLIALHKDGYYYPIIEEFNTLYLSYSKSSKFQSSDIEFIRNYVDHSYDIVIKPDFYIPQPKTDRTNKEDLSIISAEIEASLTSSPKILRKIYRGIYIAASLLTSLEKLTMPTIQLLKMLKLFKKEVSSK